MNKKCSTSGIAKPRHKPEQLLLVSEHLLVVVWFLHTNFSHIAQHRICALHVPHQLLYSGYNTVQNSQRNGKPIEKSISYRWNGIWNGTVNVHSQLQLTRIAGAVFQR